MGDIQISYPSCAQDGQPDNVRQFQNGAMRANIVYLLIFFRKLLSLSPTRRKDYASLLIRLRSVDFDASRQAFIPQRRSQSDAPGDRFIERRRAGFT